MATATDARAQPVTVRSPRRALVLAALLVLVLQRLIPFGRELLYPFTLMATWVHEMGHGLTALMAGGRFDRLQIFGDASGLAHASVTPGWRGGLVAVGGLLAPPIAGAVILALARGPRRARLVLAGLATALIASVVIWVRSPAGLIAMPLVAAALGFVAWRGTPDRRLLVAQLTGLLLAVDTFTRLDYLFTPSTEIDGAQRPSDIAHVAGAFGGHYMVSGLLLAVVSLSLCAVGLWAAWRRGSSGRRPVLRG